MKRARQILGLAALVLFGSAHVGSPDVYFEGKAGGYGLRVIVRAAAVVPGLADITVRVLSGGTPRAVTVLPVFWDPRTAAPPPADTARQVTGEPLLYTAQLWFMRVGTYAVQVTVAGDVGGGTVNVPVQAIASRRLEMRTGMVVVLAAVGLFLVIGLVTIARAAALEGALAPGVSPDAKHRRRGWIAAGIASVVIGVGAFSGRSWWNAVDGAYQRTIYRPTLAEASRSADGGLILRLGDQPTRERRWTPIIPDHGHLIHLFLVRTDLGAFAHLHPALRDTSLYQAALPALPAGRYRVYADLVRESGFSETVTDSIELPGGRGQAGVPDDGWWVEHAGPSGESVSLADGATITWNGGSDPAVAGAEAPLRFSVSGPGGRAPRLEPYLGMLGHAIVSRDDGGVFVHLHPMGTISWASQQTFAFRTPADTLAGSLTRKLEAAQRVAHGHMESADSVAVLSFPYAFPSAGEYRVWVQVKRAGRVLTGSFPVSVSAASSGT